MRISGRGNCRSSMVHSGKNHIRPTSVRRSMTRCRRASRSWRFENKEHGHERNDSSIKGGVPRTQHKSLPRKHVEVARGSHRGHHSPRLVPCAPGTTGRQLGGSENRLEDQPYPHLPIDYSRQRVWACVHACMHASKEVSNPGCMHGCLSVCLSV